MALIDLTVRRSRGIPQGAAKNYDSETWGYNDNNVISVVPSVCKKDGVSDGLVNSKVTVNNGLGKEVLWCTETVATIVAKS